MNRTALSTLLAVACSSVAAVCATDTTANPDRARSVTVKRLSARQRLAELEARQRGEGFAFERGTDGELAARIGSKGTEATVRLEGDRVAITPTRGRFALGMRTHGVGRHAAVDARPITAATAVGQELVLAHASFEERDLAGPLGLEQTFHLAERPAGAGPLVVEVAFDGLAPVADPTQPDRVALVDGRHRTRAVYRDLAASDADGRDLAAHFEVTPDSARLVIEDADARYPIVVDPLVVSSPEVLTGKVGDAFGYAVAVDGDTALVGAPERDYDVSKDCGAVDVYVRSGGAWHHQQEIKAPAGSGLFFGSSLAISGDTAIIGPYADTGYYCKGNTYVFVRSGSTWSLQQQLVGSPHVDCFGESVSIDGDTALIGASNGADYNYTDPGAAFVFVRSGSTWTQQHELTSGKTKVADGFGSAVSLRGDEFLVTEAEAGVVHAYHRRGCAWEEEQALAVAGKRLASVSLDDDTALIWAWNYSQQEPGAYVFTRNGSTWSLQQGLGVSPGKHYFGNYGWVSLSGNVAIVETDAYLRTGTSWVKQPSFFTPAHAKWLDGLSVAVSGSVLLMGAPTNSPINSASSSFPGEVYAYELSGLGGSTSSSSSSGGGRTCPGTGAGGPGEGGSPDGSGGGSSNGGGEASSCSVPARAPPAPGAFPAAILGFAAALFARSRRRGARS